MNQPTNIETRECDSSSQKYQTANIYTNEHNCPNNNKLQYIENNIT